MMPTSFFRFRQAIDAFSRYFDAAIRRYYDMLRRFFAMLLLPPLLLRLMMRVSMP